MHYNNVLIYVNINNSLGSRQHYGAMLNTAPLLDASRHTGVHIRPFGPKCVGTVCGMILATEGIIFGFQLSKSFGLHFLTMTPLS